jgi:hypothetical protein
MRFFGTLLMALGILVGIAAAALTLLGAGGLGVPWLLSVAITKLTFMGALGLLGGGAVLHRIDRRRQERQLPPGEGSED